MSVDARVAGLSPQRRELLARLMSARNPVQEQAPREPHPLARDGSATFPLTSAQRRVLFASRLDGAGSFHTSFGVVLTGPLDHAALRAAVNGLAQRHESLRTTFADTDGEPRQRIHSRMDIPLAIAEDCEDARAHAAREARRAFDLETGPLLRLTLYRLGDDEHALLGVAHHIILDGWSVAIALRELASAYRGSGLAEPAVQVADFAQWEAAQGPPEAGVAYWRDALAQPRPALELPFAAQARGTRRKGAKHRFRVRQSVLARLPAEPGTTLFVTLLTAFKATLARYSGEYDLTIGTVVAGRDRADAEPVIGNFINMLALRTKLDAAQSFRAARRAVRGSAVQGFAHREVPFERVVAELAEARDPHRHPVFQVAFNLHNFAGERRDWGTLAERPWEHDIDDVAHDLALVATPDAGGVEMVLQYRADLIDGAAAARFASHLVRLLEAAADAPDAPLGDLDLLSEAESGELAAWAQGPSMSIPDGTVLDRIRASADRYPQATAVVAEDVTLTYAELIRRAEIRAAELSGAGIGPSDVVAVDLPRGGDLLVAILAIWRVGAAYLPLDPSYPADRLAFMLADSGARRLPPPGGPKAPLPSEPGELAYVIYTSGSTGRPKGVLITHRSLQNFLAHFAAESEKPVWLAQTSLSFDISTLELFLPLTTGGTVVLAGDHAGRDGEGLLRLIRRHGVTHVQATPSGWRVLLAAGFASDSIVALVGGEALPEPLARELAARTGRLVNVYGPTETTVWSTLASIGPGEAVTIGRPIANTWTYVLDERRRPVPAGLPGELYIGGDGVARGYHARPGLTAERFLPDPFRGDPHRMYRTGDRVRRRHDGRLEFIGRTDNQIKLRGHRIELGEIESALTAHPGVEVAAVVVRPDRHGDPALAAYIVGEATETELREHLAHSLPAHLIPAGWVSLPELPLTPNGKLDRAALPAPEFGARQHTAPRSPAEELVAAVWSEVLGAGNIGVDDDFFARGGHSLLAARVVARLRAASGVDVQLRDVFAYPTVEGLAARLASQTRPHPGWVPDPQAPPVLSYGQERLWFMDQLTGDSGAYIIAAGLRLRRPVGAARLQAALDHLALRHEPLRSRFTATPDGEPVVVIEDAVRVPLATVTARDEEHAREIFAEHAAEPFDLSVAPVVRAVLIRITPQDHALLLAVHHIAGDGWSTEILLRELTALLDGATLPPLSGRYRDFAAWQRATLGAQQLDYWRDKLDRVPVLELSADRPRPAEQTFHGEMHDFTLHSGLTEALHRLGREHGATLYMTLLAAFQALLSRYSGQQDFAVGSPVAGRTRPEWEELAGLFINMLAMRADLSGDPPFTELLARVRATALAGYAHGDMPFELLVKELQVPRDVSRSPVFQVVMALHNYAASGLESFGGQARFTRYELGLYFTEREGRVDASLAYRTDLFDAVTIQRMAGHFVNLLEAIVQAPTVPVNTLDILSESEVDEIVYRRNDVPAVDPPAAALHHVVQGPPDAVAVGDGATELTYGQLERLSNRVANTLLAQGVVADTVVAVCLPQETRIIAAILGVLKAGGAYLPLDAGQPAARLATLLEGVDHVITPQWFGALAQDDTDPGVTVAPGQFAYVIYTSGSTGRPKGVAVQHAQILNYLAGVRQRLGIVAGSSFGLPQSLAFDFGITTLYLALMTGGRLCLLPKHIGGEELAGYALDYLKLTPSHLAALAADLDDPAEVASLLPRRMLILGGEASRLEWARSLAAVGTCEVVNHYGPTEATVGVTTFRVGAEGPAHGVTPIGRPLPHARVYILDEHRRPVPDGVVGEVYLGGDRLARGYLGRPDLTAERFVEDPFAGGRMYRTGDRGRWLPGGDVEFLGRGDDQVKIRGYRVEPGEVEAVLRTHPAVAQAVVVAQDAQRLAAYLVGEPVTAQEMRAFLADRLPDYLVPAFFVWLEALPLKAHGKVDRSLLPAPVLAAHTEPSTPEGPIQTVIASVFAETLELPGIGTHDDFFALGGHSLLAIGVIARLRRRLPPGTRPVSVLDLFKHPTVAGLAALAESADSGPRPLLHELTPAVSQPVATIVTVPYGGAGAMVFQPLADALPPGYRLLSVAVPGNDFGFEEERRPLEAVAAQCVEEILQRVSGPLVLYGHCGPGGALTIDIALRLEAAGREIGAVYLGGVFPFAAPQGKILGPLSRLVRMDRLRGDRVHATWLRGLGADLEGLEDSQIRHLIRTMREEARGAERYFTELAGRDCGRIQAPVISVVGERDPSTEYYQERFREWGFLTSAGTGLVVLEEAGHFFPRYRAAELASIVTGKPEVSPGPGKSDEAQGPPPSLRRFLAVATGQLVSMTGTALTEFAVPIWIYLKTGSLVQFALFFAIGVVPGLLALPVAGAVADRFDRRRVMLAGDVAAGSLQAVLLALVWNDTVRIGHVYVLLALLSAVLPFQRVAYQAAVPQLVPKRYLGHANGLNQMLLGAGQLMVPLFAAGLLAGVGLKGILLLDVAGYLLAIALLLGVGFPKLMGHKRTETFRQEIAGGFRYSIGRPGLRAMVLFFVAFNLFFSPLSNMVAPLVLGFGTLADVAYVATAAALGVLAGGLLMTVWGGPGRRRMTGMLLAAALLGAACALIGLRPSAGWVAACAFAMTCCLAVVNGIYTTIVQVKVEQRYHARVFALNMMVAWSTLPVGIALLGPAVAAWIGVGQLYVVFGVVIVLLALASLRLPGLGRFDERVPDALPDDAEGLRVMRAMSTGT